MNAIVLALLLAAAPASRESRPSPFPGRKTNWHGYACYTFARRGRKCIVVAPKEPAPGKPWIWRARFFGHEPQTDLALLARGWHVAYCDVANLYGCPRAVAIWNDFYHYLTAEHAFARKVVLEGMSRGGLIIFNWAIANPEKVACIYADAPVCDFKSWPGGKGKGKGAPGCWRACIRAYGLKDEQEALDYRGNPIDNLAPLARAKVPILSICGGADNVVPVAENTAILAERYKKLGGPIQVIIKPGCGHHPHSLKDPTPIVQFILAHAPKL